MERISDILDTVYGWVLFGAILYGTAYFGYPFPPNQLVGLLILHHFLNGIKEQLRKIHKVLERAHPKPADKDD